MKNPLSIPAPIVYIIINIHGLAGTLTHINWKPKPTKAPIKMTGLELLPNILSIIAFDIGYDTDAKHSEKA